MEAFNNVVLSIKDFLWGPIMLCLLIGTHVLLTIRTKVIQRKTFTGIKLSVTPDAEASGDIGGFAALATALAATIGTGNIVGVATAIGIGGPGAVFWMWFTGLLGMATKFGEATLAVKYRVKAKDGSVKAKDGSFIGGPMYALERGLGHKWLGVLFAIFTGIACFGIGNMTQANSIAESMNGTFGIPKIATGIVLMGNMTQANSIAESMNGTFGVPKIATGIVLMIITGLVILGGVKSISKVCEKLIPLMAGLYIVGCIVICVINGAHIPAAFAAIVLVITGLVILGGVKSISKVCEKLIPIMAGLYIVGCIVICIVNGAHIPAAFAAIVKGAFNPAAAGGGFVGATVVACIRAGVSRGLFTNESGLGSAPIVDACAATRNPSRQALISMSGVFWDTIVVCLLTGLVLVSSIIKDPVGMEGLVGANMTAGAFNAIPIVGPAVLTFGLLTFAWSTILGWSYYGERCWVYLCGFAC
ncbi:amino acid carrier protein [Firmicutes bacterium CAG:102]|nr:amino acid carrier protein [Firmicutes bacterium CAG:102]